jgi:tripartite-type tricarboxylate transporter receptor subunit TctC
MKGHLMLERRRKLLLGAAAGSVSAVLPAENAFAQSNSFPTRPITFICPWPAGGTSDATMRVLAQVVSKELGQTVVVENRAGAAGMIGAKAGRLHDWTASTVCHAIFTVRYGSN